MKKLQYCVYILHSQKDNNFYIGFTTNLHNRLTSHINGQSSATALRRPFDLIFCQYFLSKSDALRRERYFKTTAGKNGLRQIVRDALRDTNLTLLDQEP